MAKRQFRAFAPFQDNQDVQMHDVLTNLASMAEQDTMPLAAVHEARQLMAVQRMISAGLARLQNPQPEGLSTRGLKAVKAGTDVLGMFPVLTLTNALSLLIVSFSYYISILKYGDLAFEFFFLPGLLL